MDKNGNWSVVYSDTITLNTPKTLTVNVTGNGTVTGPSISCTGTGCTQTYPTGTQVTLGATQWADYLFTGWTGGCTGTGGCTVTMNGAVTVNATFSYVQPAKILTTPYSTLQNAFNAALNGSTILAREYTFIENDVVSAGNGNTITLKGGYNTSYSEPPGGLSLIQGSLTIGTGSVIISNVGIK